MNARRPSPFTVFVFACLGFFGHGAAFVHADETLDFNQDIRPILSNNCFLCHGPDEEGVQAGLRLDKRDAAIAALESGETAIVPNKPDASELIARITSDDDSIRMPPSEHGAKLSPKDIATLRKWIEQGAPFAKHWSYVSPQRPDVPSIDKRHANWPINDLDRFVLRRMVERDLAPSPPADRYALARRVFLDLTGLPPTVEEVDAFVNSKDPHAYEKLVDDLLSRPSFGEHWARKWLDLARYADSAGYADDPPRTIWAYRDWVIRAMNDNMPFDQFTVEQLAGDLLKEPTEQQLIATAFHRNTMTNSEGGTQDEEFRNVAIVDRVNTTMAVWMGTTMACAQCHTHKYDPITQQEYFQFFAIFNSTEDSDRRNESPTIPIFTEDQKRQRQDLEEQLKSLQRIIDTPTPQLAAAQQKWETRLQQSPKWQTLTPESAKRSSKKPISIANGIVTVSDAAKKDVYSVDVPLSANSRLAALRLETLPTSELPNGGSGLSGGNFVITSIRAQLVPNGDAAPAAKFVRITNNGSKQILSLAEVQVISQGRNVATDGTATQHSTAFAGPPKLAIDGNTDGNFDNKSVTHTDTVDNPWWELQLKAEAPIEQIVIWNRTDNNLQQRLSNFTVELLDSDRDVLWSTTVKDPPKPSATLSPSNIRDVPFASAFADYHQPQFEPSDVLTGKAGRNDGWAIGGKTSEPHQLVLVPAKALHVEKSATLRIVIEQNSPHENHLLGNFRLSSSQDQVAIERSRIPTEYAAIFDKEPGNRSPEEAAKLADYYRASVAPGLKQQRDELGTAQKKLAGLKPATSVPIYRELKAPRKTHLQHRGNYLDKGDEVQPGLPATFHAAPKDSELNRLAVARWLVSRTNPLTPRVQANRFWESIFGRGLVATSEEFGSQGEPPTHPELLDWLATELLEQGWNRKEFLRMLVTSATYRQSSKVDDPQADPDNRWLARGPRVRLTAEMVRDQALLASGLLSDKMYGAPVRPPQPSMGLTAAFGSSTDWKTSQGPDRYRRGIYTTWRRSNPYPSMAAFDAPNREVCTVRRNRTNTPLQSLVTLNDPVYVEAAQALARLALQVDGSLEEQLALAFRRCVSRPPSEQEMEAMQSLYNDARASFDDRNAEAMKLATDPIGALPEGMKAADAAAMTVVSNVLLNLDEMFLKR